MKFKLKNYFFNLIFLSVVCVSRPVMLQEKLNAIDEDLKRAEYPLLAISS